MKEIIWQTPAMNKLNEIMDYIANDSPKAAHKYGLEIYTRVNELLKFPDVGTIYSVSGQRITRKLIIGKTKSIFYRTTKNTIFIIAIQDNRQNWKK
jgi:plasmid stabilization system protein ParE